MEFVLYERSEHFDYFDTELDGALAFQFGDQLARARIVLSGRSYEQIENGLDSLHWLLGQGGQRFMAEIRGGEHGEAVFMNRAKALSRLIPVFDLKGQTGFPRATWPDYFALLALASVGEELYYEGQSWEEIHGSALVSELDLHEEQQRHDWRRWGTAMEALEAVCYAAYLDTQRQRGGRGKQAAMRPFDELRRRLLTHYDAQMAGGRRSDRGAAKRLYQLFQDEVDGVLTTDDPVHQIAKWIGRHRRQSQA